MIDNSQKYMVEFVVPSYFSNDMEELVASQQLVLERLFYEGKIFSCTVSMDLTKLWMVMIADTESELLAIIDKLPIAAVCDYNYKELLVHNTVQFIPENSLN